MMVVNKNSKVRKGFILKYFLVVFSIFLLLGLFFVFFEYTKKGKLENKFIPNEKLSRLSYYVQESNGKPIIYLQARTPLLDGVDRMEVVFINNQQNKKEKLDFRETLIETDHQIWRVNLGEFNANEAVEFYVNGYQKNGDVKFWDNDGLNYRITIKKNNDKLDVAENLPKNLFFFYFDDYFGFKFLNKITEKFKINRMKADLEKIPFRRHRKAIKAIEDFKKDHFVVVSLTTSPNRISKIKHVIDTLDLTFVDEVVIAVPNVYARTQSEYLIPKDLEGYKGKTKILRVEKDLGPITKLLPAVEYVRSKPNGENGIVITVDDDVGYSKGLISELILGIMHRGKSAVSGLADDLSRWNIAGFAFPEANKNKSLEIYNEEHGKAKYIKRDIVEGYSGIVYRVKDVDTELMKFLSQRKGFKECFISDDLVISFVLAYSGVDRYRIESEYITLKLFPYGANEDALHRGAEFLSEYVSWDMNALKYDICYKKLIGATMDFETLTLKDRAQLLKE